MTRADRPTLEQIERELARRDTMGRRLRTAGISVGVLLVVLTIAVLLATFFIPVLRVSGTSMAPTLDQNEIVVAVKGSNFERGDIVAFYYNNKILLKRVVAGAGDWVDLDENGNVYVNNVKIEDPYAVDKGEGICDTEFPYQVPENSWFVLGDNRGASIDSRSAEIGCVKDEDMIGRVLFRVYPIRKITVFRK